MGHLVNIDLFAKRCWRQCAIPELVPCNDPLLEWLPDDVWPIGDVDRRQLVDVDEVVWVLPFALADEAMADGASVADVVAVMADALDPPS
jgi:hypothetical protein